MSPSTCFSGGPGPGQGFLVSGTQGPLALRSPPPPHSRGEGKAVLGNHLEAMECVPLPPPEAGPGAGGTERGPDAAGAAGPHTGHGSGR